MAGVGIACQYIIIKPINIRNFNTSDSTNRANQYILELNVSVNVSVNVSADVNGCVCI